MDVPALGAVIGWAGTAIGGATLFAKNAKKVERMIYGAVREVKDLQVLSRVDLNTITKSLRSLEVTIKATHPQQVNPQPAKKIAASKAAHPSSKAKTPAKRQPRKAGK